jgi:Holliday junction resolvase-like predicted endonuclease
MDKIKNSLDSFLLQAQTDNLKTNSYPNEHDDLRMKVSFGMGMPARIPWIAFIIPEMQVSKGFYPVYLYYKKLNTLVLAYGISETSEFDKTWPAEIMNSSSTIEGFFDEKVPRYGSSFVFRAYKIKIENGKVIYYSEEGGAISDQDVESELKTILGYYKKIVSVDIKEKTSAISQGLFYMEKQLEDFIIQNWENTELGKKLDLIIEDGELVSQQYRTDIGQIDILAKEKGSDNFVVIELKKDQTSDDTVGQLARYMGWIKRHKGNEEVKGIIIAGHYDKKLDYAQEMMNNIEVFIYEVDFNLRKFKKN